jgi:membrane-associated protein
MPVQWGSAATIDTRTVQMEVQELTTGLGSWGYPGLLVLLLLMGIGSPVPEDVLLLSAGYLASAGILEWPRVFVVCCCGVVASDLMLYAGRHLAWHSERWPEGHFSRRRGC